MGPEYIMEATSVKFSIGVAGAIPLYVVCVKCKKLGGNGVWFYWVSWSTVCWLLLVNYTSKHISSDICNTAIILICMINVLLSLIPTLPSFLMLLIFVRYVYTEISL